MRFAAILVVLVSLALAACGSDAPAADDFPELKSGQPTKLLLKYWENEMPYCGLFSAVPLVIRDYSQADFEESYSGNGYWMLRTRIEGEGPIETIRRATWRVNEITKNVENISGPENCWA